MKLLAVYDDPYYEDQGITQLRYTARVFLRNNEGKYAFLRIVGEDGFGLRDHIESAGGGVEEGETFLEAAHREVAEELGFKADRFQLIGMVIDEYHLIERMTCSVFFSAQLVEDNGKTQRTQEETILIQTVEWLHPHEVLGRLSTANSPVGSLIHRRDLTAFVEHLTQRQTNQTE